MTPEPQRGAMTTKFDDHWLIEALRLRESLWGPLEDSAESARARADGVSFETRLLRRSRLLAAREGLRETLSQWRAYGRLSFLLLTVIAFLAGCGAAATALGGSGTVNLAPAITGLLGIHVLAFLLWVASFGLEPGAAGSVLARAWLALTRKIARGPNSTLLARALLELFARQKLQRWGAGVLSHWFWALALVGALLTLLGLLATRRYTFHWETTLLNPDTFVTLVQALGFLPGLLGFPQPDAETIRSSSGLLSLPESAHAAWSVWLIGVVVVYGLLPRLAALLLSGFIVRQRLGRMQMDASLPGLAELRDRLMPRSENTGLDEPAPATQLATLPPSHRMPGSPGLVYLLGLELPAELGWDAAAIPDGVFDLGIIDTREQRREVLDALRRQSARRLLVCCDARQTPDRGTVAQLAELAGLSEAVAIALLPAAPEPARREQWQQQLKLAGFTPEQIFTSFEQGVGWLSAAATVAPDPDAPSVLTHRFQSGGSPA